MTAIDNRPYNPSHLNGCPAQRTWTPYSVGCRCSELAVMARADRYWGFDQFAVNDPEPHFDCGRTDCDGGCHERTVEQFDRGQM